MTSALRFTALITLTGILYLLLGPATALEQGLPHQDKAAHFLAFGLVLWAFGILIPRWPRTALAALVILLGGATEIIQGLIGRDAEWLDFAADIAGVAVALAVWSAWRRFSPRRAIEDPLVPKAVDGRVEVIDPPKSKLS